MIDICDTTASIEVSGVELEPMHSVSYNIYLFVLRFYGASIQWDHVERGQFS